MFNQRQQQPLQMQQDMFFGGGDLEPEDIYPEFSPSRYTIITGLLLTGLSSEYPFLVCTDIDNQIYFVPSSVFDFGSSLYALTKSQRSKISANHQHIPVGGKVRALVQKNQGLKDEIKDYTVKALCSDSTKDQTLPSGGFNSFTIMCAFSDEQPQRCYSKECGLVHNNMDPKQKPIPNVVYGGTIYWRHYIDGNNGKLRQSKSNMYVKKEIIRITKIWPRNILKTFTGYEEQYAFLHLCPWNKEKLDTNEIQAPYFLDTPVFPPRPDRVEDKQKLWYFEEHNRLINALEPRRHVQMTGGLSYSYMKQHHIEPIKDGQLIIAKIVYNEFIPGPGYYLEFYTLPISPTIVKELRKRIIIHNAMDIHEYHMRIRQSCLFKGFYVCNDLNIVLIADPKGFLRNVDMERHRVKGCPVWVRLEPDVDRLAPFSIAALDKESGEYTKAEKMMSYPNISGVGILVESKIGAVFSMDHSQTPIRVSDLHKMQIPIGHFFYFTASYWPSKGFYLIGNVQIISPEIRPPLQSFCINDKDRILFADKLICYTLQLRKAHHSSLFGPIHDPRNLVTNKAKKLETAWPKNELTFVSFSPDWTPGRDSQMILYALDDEKIREKMKLVTGTYVKKPAKKPSEGDKRKNELKLSKLWHVLRTVPQAFKMGEVPSDQILSNMELLEEANKLLNEYQDIVARI